MMMLTAVYNFYPSLQMCWVQYTSVYSYQKIDHEKSPCASSYQSSLSVIESAKRYVGLLMALRFKKMDRSAIFQTLLVLELINVHTLAILVFNTKNQINVSCVKYLVYFKFKYTKIHCRLYKGEDL